MIRKLFSLILLLVSRETIKIVKKTKIEFIKSGSGILKSPIKYTITDVSKMTAMLSAKIKSLQNAAAQTQLQDRKSVV